MNESKSLVVVTQLPIIENQLQEVKASIDCRISEALSLAVTEDSLKFAKSMRATLNKEFKQLEDRRKEVKKSILEPYERFEEVYSECASKAYQRADAVLKGRIQDVENQLKADKSIEIKNYFNEYRESLGIPTDLVQFEAAGIVVTLSASKKSLYEQAKKFLDRIKSDIDAIEVQEFRDEIMTEFKKTLNASSAINIVSVRHKQIEIERKRREAEAEERAAREKAAQKVEIVSEENKAGLGVPCAVECGSEEVTASDSAPADTKIYSTMFCVHGTIAQLKALKEFLVNGGYRYEQQ